MSGRRSFGRVRKLPSGRWQARFPAPDGSLQPAPQLFATKTAATRYLASVEADIQRGTFQRREEATTTVAEWGARFLVGHAATIKPSTRAGYDSLLRTCIVPAFGQRTLASIRRSEVRAWVADMSSRLGPSRVRKALILLSMLLAAAVDDELLEVNVAHGLRGPRLAPHEPRVLMPAEVRELRMHVRAPYGLLVDVLAFGGLRLGEALALRRHHVDLAHARLDVREAVSEVGGHHHVGTPKNHQQRQVTLPQFLVEDLRTHLDALSPDPSTLLFPNRAGGFLHYTSLRRNVWDPACAAAGLSGLTPHDLRATCGSWTADALGVLAAAQRLGHSNASVTTRHYARPRAGVQMEAAEVLEALHDSAPSVG